MNKIDLHAHYGLWMYPTPVADPVERLLRLCEREQIQYMVCSSALALLYDMQAGNAEMAEAFHPHQQLLGYVYVNANFLDESVAEMETYLPLDDFVGVKIHPRLSGVPCDAPRMAELFAEVAARSSLLLMHTVDRYAAHQMAEFARQYPQLNIVLGHSGHTDSDEAARVAAETPNIYLEFCCEWPGAGKVERALQICGPGKIVFGTDADLLEPAFTRGMFEAADLTPEQAQLIYWDNAAGLLGIPTDTANSTQPQGIQQG